MKERLLAAFYHRGRKAFVEWTSYELARRIKQPVDNVGQVLAALERANLAKGSVIPLTRNKSWELTTAGKIEARAIIEAQDIVRSA